MSSTNQKTSSQQVSYRLGVDIGGTFTDIVLVGPSGQIMTRKVSSTEDDYARGIVTGIREILASVDGRVSLCLRSCMAPQLPRTRYCKCPVHGPD